MPKQLKLLDLVNKSFKGRILTTTHPFNSPIFNNFNAKKCKLQSVNSVEKTFSWLKAASRVLTRMTPAAQALHGGGPKYIHLPHSLSTFSHLFYNSQFSSACVACSVWVWLFPLGESTACFSPNWWFISVSSTRDPAGRRLSYPPKMVSPVAPKWPAGQDVAWRAC